jgi:ABC-2 type transport system ATP-binding protein
MLQLNQYRKHYGPTLVLQVTSLLLEPGIYWLKGVNGAGKTTLLTSIAGLIPFEGSIQVGGRDIRKERTDYLKIVNYAPAEPVYPPFLTGQDLIHFYTSTKGRDKASLDRLVKTFGAAHYLHGAVSTYSSGMLKKLSLILAFIGQPRLILLDEPFITLDAEAVVALRLLIEQAYASGTSFCISAHGEAPLPQPMATLYLHQQTLERV